MDCMATPGHRIIRARTVAGEDHEMHNLIPDVQDHGAPETYPLCQGDRSSVNPIIICAYNYMRLW